MTIINKEEEKVYGKLTDELSLVIFFESCKEIDALDKTEEQSIEPDEARRVGNIIGPRVLAKTIDFTKDMSREDLVKLLAHSVGWYSTFLMNEDPAYFTKVLLQSQQSEEQA